MIVVDKLDLGNKIMSIATGVEWAVSLADRVTVLERAVADIRNMLHFAGVLNHESH